MGGKHALLVISRQSQDQTTHFGKENRMKNPNGMKRPHTEALKEKFLQCFGVRTTSATALQTVVKRLVKKGVSRDILVQWGVQAGYPRATVSSTLSRIFCAIGLRERNKGAGRKPSPDALELLDYARRQYGVRALKVLRAALRAGRTEAGDAFQNEPDAASVKNIHAAVKLQGIAIKCSTALTRGSKTARFNRAPRPAIAGTPFKTIFDPRKRLNHQTSSIRL
jgi:hypothetical protein